MRFFKVLPQEENLFEEVLKARFCLSGKTFKRSLSYNLLM